MTIHYRVEGYSSSSHSQASSKSLYTNAESALAAVEAATAEIVLLCNDRLFDGGPTPPAEIDQYDLLHAGLDTGEERCFRSLWLASANWLYLDPVRRDYSVSWKATPDWCWIRPDIVRRLGGFDRGYISPQACLADMAYRMLAAGGRVCQYLPGQGFTTRKAAGPQVPLSDELLFINRHVGFASLLYAVFWLCLRTRHTGETLRALTIALSTSRKYSPPQAKPDLHTGYRLVGAKKRQQVGKISAVIPTLDRYPYLPGAIDSLLGQTPPPDEIIIVDQTRPETRQPEIYQPYGERVRVIYLDQNGQSLARNAAISTAYGDWIFLFDDDSAAYPGMIAAHISALEYSGVDGSTGVSLAPWKTVEDIPARTRHYRLSDVLDTGNCLIKKSTLEEVGLLDRAFDHGSGADNDLGTRLHLSGHQLVFNPRAIRTHYKASSGGLRTHGAWWRDKTSLRGPFPAPTQVYTVQRYYPEMYWKPLYIRYFFTARKRYHFWPYVWLLITAPWKLARAVQAAACLRSDQAGAEVREIL